MAGINPQPNFRCGYNGSDAASLAALTEAVASIKQKVDAGLPIASGEYTSALAALAVTLAQVKARTDNLPSDPGDASDIAASIASLASSLTTINGYLDTEVAAILARVNLLPAAPCVYNASAVAALQTSLNLLTASLPGINSQSGTKLLSASEQTIYEVTSATPRRFLYGLVNLPTSALGIARVRTYMRYTNGGSYRLVVDVTGIALLSNPQLILSPNALPATALAGGNIPVHVPPIIHFGTKVTLAQTTLTGGAVTADYCFYDTTGA